MTKVSHPGRTRAPAVVVDLVEPSNVTILHLDVLTGAVDSYLALARRVETAA